MSDHLNALEDDCDGYVPEPLEPVCDLCLSSCACPNCHGTGTEPEGES